MSDISYFISNFESFSKGASPKTPSWMKPIRREAISCFAQLGFPTLRNEEWKYTSVEPLVKKSFHFNFGGSQNGVTLQKIESFLFGQRNWTRLVFLNGNYVENLSFFSKEAKYLRLGSLANALQTKADLLEGHLTRLAPFQKDAFTALNTAFIQDGAFMDLPEGEILQEPIHLLFLSTSGGGEILSLPRNLILIGKGSRVTLIEDYISLDGNANWTNAVTEVLLGEASEVTHYKIQREDENVFHTATTQVALSQGSRFHSYSISTGGRLTRNNLNVILSAEGAECVLNGLYLAAGEQLVDNHTVIDHAKPRGLSRQLYKGILGGKSKGVFSGKIYVRRDAQKTDAHQANKNLLLSREATADTKPQLEIFADDVKCSHGAAVGQLDEDSIFYLKSRGVGHEKAQNILTYGFASEVIEPISVEPVRLELEQLVYLKLQNSLAAERVR